MKIRLQLFLSIYGIILGILVAILAFLFIFSVNFLIDLLWGHTLHALTDLQYWPLIICPIGGILVGILQKYIGPYPKEMNEVLTEFRANGRVEYKDRIWRTLLTAFVALTFGASLGPEAALVGICAGLITWAGDVLKFNYIERKDLTEFGIGAMLSIIFRAPLFGLASTLEGEPQIKYSKLYWQKVCIYALSVGAGFITFYYLLHLGDGAGLFVLLGQTTLTWTELLLFIPLIFIGKYFGLLYDLFGKVISWILKKLPLNQVFLAILGGVVLGVLAFLLPYMLFSGEHAFHDIALTSQSMSFFLLLAVGLGKLFVTRFCLDTGWRGGHIFPILFASIAVGFGLTHILPFDAMFIVAIFAVASATNILKKPLATSFIVVLFFPLPLWPFIFIAAYLSVYKFKQFRKTKTAM